MRYRQRPTLSQIVLSHALRQRRSRLTFYDGRNTVITNTNPSTLSDMLLAFVDGREGSRSIQFIARIESEFARLGLDEDESLSDLQHELAVYRGEEEDIHRLKQEALNSLRLLSSIQNQGPIQPVETTETAARPPRLTLDDGRIKYAARY